MAETQTPNLKWTKPDLGGDAATWGNVLNTTIDAIDSVVYANQQAGVPVGSLTMWAGSTTTPPTNWLICDGRTLDYGATPAYQGLFNVIGRAFNTALTGTQFALPNLTQKFPIGAGTNVLGAVGGTFSYTLATANLPPHAHPITDVAHNHGASQPAHVHPDPGHTHGVTDPQHFHQGSYNNAGNTLFTPVGGGEAIQPGPTNYAATGISINAAATGLQAAQPAITVAASGTGLSTTQNAGSGAALSIVPPFIAINFIIRFQ